MKSLRFLLVMVIGFTVLSWVLIGCDGKSGGSSKNQPGSVEPVTNVSYMGQDAGCKEHYDPLFCDDRYKPGNLNAGTVEVVKDVNGSPVIINRVEK